MKQDAPPRPSFIEAAAWCAGLSLLFMVVYGGTNWFTSQRDDVGTVYFAWERYIPLVPILIIPYMSIDLFFVGSMFLCRRREDLHLLGKRLAMAILIAGACFLLFPLKLAVPRPAVEGWLGTIFGFLRGFDQPHNLAPSLHIALRWILWFTYVRNTKGLTQTAVQIWFLLIGVSTLLVWQHHVIDIVTGQMLALLCFYAWPEACSADDRCPKTCELAQPNRKVGRLYAAGAVVLLIAGVLLRPWGLLLLWPAFSLAMLATAYFRAGPSIFRKSRGRLPISVQFWFGPYLLGAWLSWQYYRRQASPYVEVVPDLYLGGTLTNREARSLVQRGVRAVLDLTAEYDEAQPLLELTYKNLPTLDLTAPTTWQLQAAADFLDEQLVHGPVYVHCALGYSRSACVVAAWLISTGRAGSVDDAIEQITRVRPRVVFKADSLDALRSIRPQPAESSRR